MNFLKVNPDPLYPGPAPYISHDEQLALALQREEEEKAGLQENFAEQEQLRLEQKQILKINMFKHFHSLADRVYREDSKVQSPIKKGNIFFKKDEISRTFQTNYSVAPFRKETNFNAERIFQPIHTQNIIFNILSALGNLFLGYEFLNSNQDPKTPKQIQEDLDDDFVSWENQWSMDYSDSFNKRIQDIFNQAHNLLQDRKEYAIHSKSNRMRFYVVLVLSTLSYAVGQRTVAKFGFLITMIQFIYMLTLYGTSSYRQGKLVADLKYSLETAERAAGIPRTDSQQQLNL